MTTALADRLGALMADEGVDVSGIGGTLTGNALAVAAMRATLANALRERDFAVAVPLAERFTTGVQAVIEAHGLAWSVQRLGCRAESGTGPRGSRGPRGPRPLCPVTAPKQRRPSTPSSTPTSTSTPSTAGILLTPFHNMALVSAATPPTTWTATRRRSPRQSPRSA